MKKTLVTRLSEQAAEPDDLPPFERFRDLAKRILSVPKGEIDAERQAETKAKVRKG